jgi:hypothetical protein
MTLNHSAALFARQTTRVLRSHACSSSIGRGQRTAFPIFTKGGPTRAARQLRSVPTVIAPRYRPETSSDAEATVNFSIRERPMTV